LFVSEKRGGRNDQERKGVKERGAGGCAKFFNSILVLKKNRGGGGRGERKERGKVWWGGRKSP